MKKTAKNIHVVKVPILNDEYVAWVVWGKKDEDVEKWLKRWYEYDCTIDYDNFKHNQGCCYYHPKYNPVIVIHNINDDFYSVLAHEAVHAVNNIFNYIGDDNRGELFAHCVGAIVRKVQNHIKNTH